jgi:hypothetical protein
LHSYSVLLIDGSTINSKRDNLQLLIAGDTKGLCRQLCEECAVYRGA